MQPRPASIENESRTIAILEVGSEALSILFLAFFCQSQPPPNHHLVYQLSVFTANMLGWLLAYRTECFCECFSFSVLLPFLVGYKKSYSVKCQTLEA